MRVNSKIRFTDYNQTPSIQLLRKYNYYDSTYFLHAKIFFSGI